jgi:hypothetical protein
VEYVLRRANGYFIYSTVEGVSIAYGPGIICNIATCSCNLLPSLHLCSHWHQQGSGALETRPVCVLVQVSFQPRDVPIGPIELTLVGGQTLLVLNDQVL